MQKITASKSQPAESGEASTTAPLAPLLAGFLAFCAIFSLALAYRNDRSAAQHHATELGLVAVDQQAREIRDIQWLAIAAREFTPESEARLAARKQALHHALEPLAKTAWPGHVTDPLTPLIADFMSTADDELRLIESRQFSEAVSLDFQALTPQFDLLQRTANQLSGEAEDDESRERFHARVQLAAAALLALLAVAVIVLRSAREKQVLLTREIALRQSEERFRALTEKSSDVVFITDAALTVSYVSPSVTATLDRQESACVGRKIGELVHPDDGGRLKVPLEAGQSHDIEFRMQHSDSNWLHFDCLVRNLLHQPNVCGLVFNAREVTAKKTAEAQLQHNASHDQLTGLPNRLSFFTRLEAVVARLNRKPEAMAAVLFLDVDDFKVVNDCLGHRAGDELIIEVGRRIQSCLRKDGMMARLGGDEFTVLVEDMGDPSDALRVAQRIHKECARPFLLDNQEVFKDVSIGIAISRGNDTAEAVMQNADIAMYRAKSRGSGGSELFDSAMHEQVMERLKMEAELRKALDANRLRLHYQPIVLTSSGKVEGFEALIRWEQDDGRFISPGVFIPIAEQCGLIIPLGSWILRTGCRRVAQWKREYSIAPPLYISINVSARQFSHPSFIRDVADAIQESGADPHCVRLELTESVAMKDAANAEQAMAQLRELGVKLSIDDFGTGYSSLSYLRKFPVDTLKIDQSFIAGIEGDEESYAIIKTVVALARSLSMEVVAEGVETPEQLEKLNLAGCDFAQGFWFSRPLPEEKVDHFLRTNLESAMVSS